MAFLGRASRPSRRSRGKSADPRGVTPTPKWLGSGWLLGALLVATAAAQQAENPDPELSSESVKARIEAVTSDTELDEKLRGELLSQYRDALNDLEAAEELRELGLGFEQAQRAAAEDLDQARETREQLLGDGASSESVEQMRAYEQASERAERLLASLQSSGDDLPVATEALKQFEEGLAEKAEALKTANKELAKWDREPKRRAERVSVIQDDAPDLRKELQQTDEDLAKVGADADPLNRAKRLALRALRLHLSTQLSVGESEKASYDARSELLQIERDIAAARAQRAAASEKRWRELVERLRPAITARDVRDAAKASKNVARQLSPLVDEVQSIKQERNDLAPKIKAANDRLSQSRDLLRDIATDFERAKARDTASGLSQASGELLRKQRESLPVPRQYRTAVADRRVQQGDIQFKVYARQDQRIALATLEDELDAYPESMREDARDWLIDQRDSLDLLITDYEKHQKTLLELNAVESDLARQSAEYAQFIDKRVLWIRSAYPWGRRDLQPARHGVNWLLRTDHWRQLFDSLANDFRNHFAAYVIAGVIIGMLIYLRGRARLQIHGLGDVVSRGGFHQFGPTLQVLGLTLAMSLAAPSIVVWFAWRLGEYGAGVDFTRAFALALRAATWPLFCLTLLAHACRPNGLAECHLAWPKGVAASLRRALRIACWIGLPLAAVVVFLDAQTTKTQWSHSLGRILFAALMCGVSLGVERTLRGRPGVLRHLMAHPGSSWLRSSRLLWMGALILAPLILAVLAGVGYYHSALVLAARGFDTLCLIAGLWFGHGVLARWVLMRRRRLAIDQFREKRRQTLGETDESEPRIAEEAPLQELPDTVNLASISKQSVKMLQLVTALLGFCGAWWIWMGVIPAITVLDDYPLWPGAEDGVSVAAALNVVLILGVTIAAVRNLPGILELTLLPYLPVDAGARYATTTLARYVSAAVGGLAAAGAAGYTFDQMQWLFATMGIGLGFGLQEIFGNFVSGLILLFERPIRVGDIITLDNTTGVVTKIRIRATTITDWDRREYVVPNRDLITGRLLNWTLTDQVNRIVIPVGVAYDADTDEARRILLQVADDHPLILQEPGPMATLEGFGDSALNLVLRCYLPNLEQRLTVIHELYTTIHRTLKEKGVDVAFPQLDVHIRGGGVPAGLGKALASNQGGAGA